MHCLPRRIALDYSDYVLRRRGCCRDRSPLSRILCAPGVAGMACSRTRRLNPVAAAICATPPRRDRPTNRSPLCDCPRVFALSRATACAGVDLCPRPRDTRHWLRLAARRHPRCVARSIRRHAQKTAETEQDEGSVAPSVSLCGCLRGRCASDSRTADEFRCSRAAQQLRHMRGRFVDGGHNGFDALQQQLIATLRTLS